MELCELMMQVTGYAGLGNGVEGMSALKDVLGAEGDSSTLPEDVATAAPPTRNHDRLERGWAMLASLNPELTRASASAQEQIVGDWLDWLVETAFGDLWSRPNLTLQERELITLAVLIARSHWTELRSHLKIAANLAIPLEEIGEAIMHLAPYVGFPAAVAAMRVAVEQLDQGPVE